MQPKCHDFMMLPGCVTTLNILKSWIKSYHENTRTEKILTNGFLRHMSLLVVKMTTFQNFPTK